MLFQTKRKNFNYKRYVPVVKKKGKKGGTKTTSNPAHNNTFSIVLASANTKV